MIVNNTKYTEKDFAFIFSRSKFDAKYRVRTTLSLLIDTAALLYCFRVIILLAVCGDELIISPLNEIMTMTLLVLASLSMYRTFTRKKRVIKSWTKAESQYTERTISFGEDSVLVSSVKEGITSDTKYSYSLLKGFTETADCLYIRTVLEDKNEIYMILHDDGYTEGSKADALSLLKRLGIAEEAEQWR